MSEVNSTIEDAIVEMVDDENEIMPTKWVLVAEYIDDDANVWIVSASSARSTVWDRIGLLDFAQATEKAKVKG